MAETCEESFGESKSNEGFIKAKKWAAFCSKCHKMFEVGFDPSPYKGNIKCDICSEGQSLGGSATDQSSEAMGSR